jgi:hypothetical protein
LILHPGILALLAGALAVAALVTLAAWHSVELLVHWDLRSGSARQLGLERRTPLVSTLVGMALAFQLASLFLYVHTADALAPLFTGAMCAAGTLAANRSGYPALLLGVASFVLGGLWLVVNHADNLGYDYPLVRRKHAFLLALAPLLLAEGALRTRFFLGLDPEVITSCCGSLFSRGGRTVGASLAALPALPTAAALHGTALAAALAGLAYRRFPRPAIATALGLLSAAALPAGLAGLVSHVSPYVYELPAHRCPFCMLQGAYGGVGYLLYGTLLPGVVCGLGAAMLAPFRGLPSLAGPLPPFQRRLALAASLLLAAFAAVSAWLVATSHLVQ